MTRRQERIGLIHDHVKTDEIKIHQGFFLEIDPGFLRLKIDHQGYRHVKSLKIDAKNPGSVSKKNIQSSTEQNIDL